MKKILAITVAILVVLSIFSIPIYAVSEPPVVEWNMTYGGANDDQAFSMIQTSDLGYALAGSTYSLGAGGWDVWLVKTDLSGTMVWNQTYGGVGYDSAWSVIQTSDGGYALAGLTRSFGAGDHDFWLVKTDPEGNAIWNQTYGGESIEIAYSLVQTDDGGYAIAGRTDSFSAGGQDVWLVKTDEDGNIMWNRTYGGTNDDVAWFVIQTSDGGYAVAGYVHSFGAANKDLWLIKTNSTGHMEWDQSYGGADWDIVSSVIQTDDGGYAMAGETYSFGVGDRDCWLVKTDGAGNVMWSQTYGGPNDDLALALLQTSDKGYILTGFTCSFGAGGQDVLFVKTDSSGNMEWSQTYGGTNNDLAWSIIHTSDGGYAVAGWTKSFGLGMKDFWLIKLGPVKIPATVDIDPDTLNLKSNGEWITAYIELPECYDVSQIDVGSILLNATILVDAEGPVAIGDYDLDNIPDLIVKFNRAAIIKWMDTNDYGEDTGKYYEVNLTITGTVSGTQFTGTDQVKVLKR